MKYAHNLNKSLTSSGTAATIPNHPKRYSPYPSKETLLQHKNNVTSYPSPPDQKNDIIAAMRQSELNHRNHLLFLSGSYSLPAHCSTNNLGHPSYQRLLSPLYPMNPSHHVVLRPNHPLPAHHQKQAPYIYRPIQSSRSSYNATTPPYTTSATINNRDINSLYIKNMTAILASFFRVSPPVLPNERKKIKNFFFVTEKQFNGVEKTPYQHILDAGLSNKNILDLFGFANYQIQNFYIFKRKVNSFMDHFIASTPSTRSTYDFAKQVLEDFPFDGEQSTQLIIDAITLPTRRFFVKNTILVFNFFSHLHKHPEARKELKIGHYTSLKRPNPEPPSTQSSQDTEAPYRAYQPPAKYIISKKTCPDPCPGVSSSSESFNQREQSLDDIAFLRSSSSNTHFFHGASDQHQDNTNSDVIPYKSVPIWRPYL